MRLPSTHAAITAPLVASHTHFPGIPIGRSLLDGRAFHLSPVLTDAALLPSTNSLGMGGLGSGKSTTGKTRTRREILHHGHQYVVIDSFGEDQTAGEWAQLTRALGGRVIDASTFTLNPCSPLLPPEVREQLIRSLIAAVEPDALTPQSTHALQHALTHPQSTGLGGLVDALVHPDDGRWPAPKLAAWGEGTAIALSRYTEGSLHGLFDGPDAALPETDLPITSFDFSRLDRNSPAIPSLMAAVACWAEHVWLPQSTAAHRHLVIEEAWQILLSPATAELIQRLLKNSRKLGLSLDVLMHTLSDLGDGKAQDLARLLEIAHVGRLGPEEAATTGALLNLPDWAIEEIPRLAPGQAVWKVGPHYVDIIQTLLDDEDVLLTDTSSRRRKAQQALHDTPAEDDTPTAAEHQPNTPAVPLAKPTTDTTKPATEPADHEHDHGPDLPAPADHNASEPQEQYAGWDWEMPPNVIEPSTDNRHTDTTTPAVPPQQTDTDNRHATVLQVAREGRIAEAAELAALGERAAITAHGINSPQAGAWIMTRARVADLSGSLGQAAHLRATVSHMRKEASQYG
ncbi:hypothetical protein [Streptomyces sp. NRRL F-5053]|uniref:hypothetical protein n=1 Tax=Streptomyces sp. NRRL F-5053 TaxID=1463854 RepID=UPI0004C4D6DF|nr:hypothetical protein [Streptomyces sp. NRRL F-5053]